MARLSWLITLFALVGAGSTASAQAGTVPRVSVGLNCGRSHCLFPEPDAVFGEGVQRVYAGDVAHCVLTVSVGAPPRPPPPCIGSLQEWLDATDFRLLAGAEPVVPDGARLRTDYRTAWWQAVADRSVDVAFDLAPLAPRDAGGRPRATLTVTGLESLPPGEYRLIAFHGASALRPCVPDIPSNYVRVSFRRAVLVLGPPRDGADRLQWLFDHAIRNLRANQPEVAIGYARRLVAHRPRSAYGYGILGRAQRAAGDCRSAVSSLRTALQLADLPPDERDPGLNIVGFGWPDGPRHHWRDVIAECEEDE